MGAATAPPRKPSAPMTAGHGMKSLSLLPQATLPSSAPAIESAEREADPQSETAQPLAAVAVRPVDRRAAQKVDGDARRDEQIGAAVVALR